MQGVVRCLGALTAALPLLTGCWDVSSPEHLLIPTLMAVDWQGGQYVLTLQAVAPALLSVGPSSGGGGGGSPTPPVWVLQGRGSSLTEAIRSATLGFPEPIALSHLEVLVLGRSVLAPRPFAGLMDSLLRTPFLVRTFWVFGAVGEAAPIAKAANPIGLYPAHVLIRASERMARNGQLAPRRFSDWVEALENGPTTVLLPMLSVRTTSPPGTGDDFQFPGSYLVSAGRLIGNLSHQATIVWTVLTPLSGEVSPIQPTISVRQGPVRYLFTLTAYRTHLTLTPQGLHVGTRVTARLDEVDGLSGPIPSPPPLNQTELARLLADHLAEAERQLIHWSQQRGADILAVGRMAAAERPEWFRSHVAHWDTYYAHLPVYVRVVARIESTGSLANP